MDADFIQAVAHVGDQVEITLANGGRFEGILSELTLTRLSLQLPDGRRMAATLPSVVTIMQTQGGADHPERLAGPAFADPAGAAHQSAVEVAAQLVATSESSPRPANAAGDAEATDSADLVDWALEQAAALADARVNMDIYVQPGDRKYLQQIRDSYDYAVKIDELDPRFARIQQIYSRTLQLWNADQRNPELTRVLGALAVAKDDMETAHLRLSQACESGDVPAMRMLAATGGILRDLDTVTYALLKYFRRVTPDADEAAWKVLLTALDARGSRGPLAELLESCPPAGPAQKTIRAAMGQIVADRGPTPIPTAPPPRPHPTLVNKRSASPVPTAPPTKAVKAAKQPPERPGQRGGQDMRQFDKNPYQYAKYLEHRKKDLRAAQAAYRQAIKNKDKRESAVKDLAWLTKRLDGSEAALKVIEVEFAGVVQPGHTLDNILIDFLPGAGRYEEALAALDRQHSRPDITTSRRYHLAHQIAFLKLVADIDAVSDWRSLLDQSPDNSTVQRGLAMALVQRGTPEALDEAELLIEAHTDDRATGIRRQIAGLRAGGQLDADLQRQLLDEAELPDPTPPLVNYVLQKFSDLARVKDQGDRETQTPIRDLMNVTAEMGRQMGGKQPENSARAYISAAVLARECGEDDDRYLYLGLTALAEVVLGRQEHDSARDLYCAALAAADEGDEGESQAEMRSGVIGYLQLLSGRTAAHRRRRDRDRDRDREPRRTPDVGDVLEEELLKHGPDVFNLIPPLLADTSMARDHVLDAICMRETLRAATATYLPTQGVPVPRVDPQGIRAAWQHRVELWSRERRALTHGLAELQHIAVSDGALESALSRLDEFESKAPEQLQDALSRVKEALTELRRYTSESSYEDRMQSLRQAGSRAKDLRVDVERGPTSLSVELVDPVASRILKLVQETQAELDLSQAPLPELALALEQSSAAEDGVVTVQIKVSNAVWRAPLESPELTIDVDPEMFSVEDPVIRLTSSVRGGDYHIQPVKLMVTRPAMESGAFSLPVTLRYRSRSMDEPVDHDAVLPVRLARENEFQPIHPNPFQDGATGRPVTNPDMFFGRGDLLAQISKRLGQANSPGIGVAVFGQKRAGKSSIRLHLTQRLREDGLPVVDIGNIGDLAPTQGDSVGTRVLAMLMWRILDGANRELVAVGAPALLPPGLDRDKFTRSPEPVYDCARLFEDYRLALPTPMKPMTVLIDEFQYIDEWQRRDLLSSSFMQAFKALIERRLFHLVIVGQAAIDRLIKADPNVFGVFQSERVTYLAHSDARLLIEQPISIAGPDRKVSRYRERAVDQILELTGGSAFYVQRFCSQLVEYMNAQRAPVVTEADVEQVREAFLDTLEAKDFDGLESSGYTEDDASASEEYRQVLLAVARASRGGQPSTIAAIRDEYQGPELQVLLDDLVMRDVIRQESGNYYIVVRLYRDWLLKKFGVNAGMRSK